MEEFVRLLEPEPGFDGEIGVWMAALEDVRRQTKEDVAGLTPEQLAWKPPGQGNSIGQLLRHIALVEADWVLSDVCELKDEEIAGLLPEMLRAGGVLGDPGVRPLAELVAVLDEVRAETRRRLAGLPAAALAARREYTSPKRRKLFSVRWIVFHILDHEASHKGQIGSVRRMLKVLAGA